MKAKVNSSIMAKLPTDVCEMLYGIADKMTPRLAVQCALRFATDADTFCATVMPSIMRAGGLSDDVSLWDDEHARDALWYVLAAKCREDLVFTSADVPVECLTDESDVYDGYGGYAHNPDDGSAMLD